MKHAWIENHRIRDAVTGDPYALFHADVAQHYDTEVPDDASPGDGWVNGQLVKPQPVPPPPPAPTPPKVSPVEFKLLFTSSERVAIKVARQTDPVLQDFFDLMDDPRLTYVDLGLKSTSDALDYLISLTLIAPARKAQILNGTLV